MPETSFVIQTLKDLLQTNKYDDLQKYCLSKEVEECVANESWEIITLFMGYLKENKTSKETLPIFAKLFISIAQIANAKELVLCILEHYDPMVKLTIVELLFPALGVVAHNLIVSDKKNNCYNLNMIFSTLLYYLESINLPTFENFEALKCSQGFEEMNNSRFMFNCVELATQLLQMQRKQLEDKLISETHFNAVKQEFMTFCCGLLERVLQLNVFDEINNSKVEEKHRTHECHNDAGKTKPSSVAACIASLAISLNSSWSLIQDLTWKRFISLEYKSKIDDCQKVEHARACLLFLLATNTSLTWLLPQVINAKFAFIYHLPSICVLMKSNNPVVVHKGLQLCRFVSNRLGPLSLTCRVIEGHLKRNGLKTPSQTLLQVAIGVATNCQSKTLRQRAAQFLTCFIEKFVWKDRFSLLHWLIETENHAGVVGYLIIYVKDKLSELLQDSDCYPENIFLKSKTFNSMLWICLRLPHASETDLLVEYDRIMSSLNLLRFVFIRDTKNQTGIWQKTKEIGKLFLDPVRTDINISRMHFREELKKQSLAQKGKSGDGIVEPEFTINALGLPHLPPGNRVQMLESAIHSFDMMEAVCARVQELIDNRPT